METYNQLMTGFSMGSLYAASNSLTSSACSWGLGWSLMWTLGYWSGWVWISFSTTSMWCFWRSSGFVKQLLKDKKMYFVNLYNCFILYLQIGGLVLNPRLFISRSKNTGIIFSYHNNYYDSMIKLHIHVTLLRTIY